MNQQLPDEFRRPEAEVGPIAQSVAIGFRAVYLVTLLLGAVWLFSDIRQIAPDSQAVVMRFGRIVRVQSSGLLLAWPRPIEQVRLLPGPDRQLSQKVGGLPPVGGIARPGAANNSGVPANAVPYLTGDGNVVLLDATLIYHIVDPSNYVLAETHIAAALDRVFHASAVKVAAGSKLNDILITQQAAQAAAAPAGQPAAPAAAAAPQANVRSVLLEDVNAKLTQLNAQGAGLGVEVDRIDMTPYLPPEAKLAFDAVLTATQSADQQVATARTEAERRRQGAQREGDRIVSDAEARASERVTGATVDTANIKALTQGETGQTRESLLQRAYRDKVGEIMNRTGSVTLIDPQSGARFVLPGKQ